MTKRLLLTAVFSAAALWVTPAWARFGKGGSGGGHASSSSGSHSSGSYSTSHSHSVSPVYGGGGSSSYVYSGGSGYAPGYSSSGYYSPGYISPFAYRPHYYSYWGYYSYAPTYVPAPTTAVATTQPNESPDSLRVTLAGDVHGFASGATLGIGMNFEGDRWGLTGNFSHIMAKADDGSGGTDTLEMIDARLTYAILAGDHGRLRLEGGVNSIFAQDLIVAGPTGGVSGVFWIGGPLAVEGSVMVTPFPHRAYDAKLGLGLGFDNIGIRAGWRVLTLDDAGLVDGVDHIDTFSGPYAGVAIVF